MSYLMNRDEVVMRYLLERNAAEAPDEEFVIFEDGSSWTRLQAVQVAAAAANELAAAGVRQGGLVAAMLPNSADYFRVLWGSAMLGAAVTPINPAYRGRLISHALDLSEPDVLVTSAECRALVEAAELRRPVKILAPSELLGTNVIPPALDRPIEPWDAVEIAMTSGTTGPSKAVRVTYAHSLHSGQAGWLANISLSNKDVYLCDVPMVHIAAAVIAHSSVANRCKIAVRGRPNLDAYWEVARDTGATMAQLYGTMVTYVDSRPLRGAEQAHQLRLLLALPLPPDPKEFKRKFGLSRLNIGWGSTECALAVNATRDFDLAPGSTGRALPGWQVRIVDEHDIEVPIGTAGEAIVRSDNPWLITTEYVKDPAATAAAWRNGWFHTGDLMRRDAEGNFYFLDRVTDSLRRRGQNISSYEVELALQSYSGILEAAVVPERSDAMLEDEVKAWIVLDDGTAELSFEALLRHCAARLPHFMVPRYFEIAPEFPKTPSAKIQKNLLRQRGNSPRTWDRIANGWDVTRHGVIAVDDTLPQDLESR